MDERTMDKEKSRLPVCETERRQTEADAQRERPFPPHDNITARETVQDYLADILPKGAEHGIKTADLKLLLGLRDTRAVRRFISAARSAGAVILSGDTGYYLPDDGEKGRQEAEIFVSTVTAKGVSTIRATESAKAFLDILPGQLGIGGVADGETESGG